MSYLSVVTVINPASTTGVAVTASLPTGSVCTGISPAAPLVEGISAPTEVDVSGTVSTAGASA